MKRRYALPAAIALTLHAVLFLGNGKPPVSKPPMVESRDKQDDLTKLIALTKTEEVAAAQEGGEQSESTVVERPPGILEPPAMVPTDNSRFTQDPEPVDIGNATKLDPAALHPSGPIKTGPTSFTADQLDEKPRPRFQKEPAYPVNLKHDRMTGTVIVDFMVDENGHVHDVRVVKSSHSGFNEATVAAVSEWRFEPGKRKGLPVRFRMSVPVVFKFEDA